MITTKYLNVARIVGIGAQLVTPLDSLVLHDDGYEVHIDVDHELITTVRVIDNAYHHEPFAARNKPKVIHVGKTPGQWNIIAGFLFDVDTVWKLNG